MASRTQLRLQQLTGSAVDIKTEAVHYVTPNTAAALTGSDVQDLFGMVGAALNRIHGAGSNEPFNNTAGVLAQNTVISGTLISKAASGQAVITLGNTAATPQLTVGDDLASGDSTVIFKNASSTNFTIGLDETAEKFTISSGNNLGGSALTMDSNGNIVIAGSLDVNGTTTTIDTVNLSVQDSIIALGISGSDGSFDNKGDRGIVFARSAAATDALPGLWYDLTNSDFNFAKTVTGPTSSSFGAISAYTNLNAGNLGVYSAAALKGTLEVSSNDIVLSSSAGNSVILDSNGGKIQISKDGENAGFIQADAGSGGSGLIISASADQALVLDSNLGFFTFGKESQGEAGNSVACVVGGGENTETYSFIKSTDMDDDNFTLQVQTALNGAYTNQFVAISGSFRIHETSAGGAGSSYVELKSPALAANRSFTLPATLAGANDDILVGATDGTFSFKSASTLGLASTPSKGIHIVTGSHAAGISLPTNTDMVGDNIAGLGVAESQGKTLDVYVNGQLLISGSASEVSAGTRDYSIAATSLTFAFALEVDDVVQVIKR